MYHRTEEQKKYFYEFMKQVEKWERRQKRKELVEKGIVRFESSDTKIMNKPFIHIKVYGMSLGCWWSKETPKHDLIEAVFDTIIYYNRGAGK